MNKTQENSEIVTDNLKQIRNKPFIVICGCTGTGKTKLSIQLAEWLIENNNKCEIINADAMQVVFIYFISIHLIAN